MVEEEVYYMLLCNNRYIVVSTIKTLDTIHVTHGKNTCINNYVTDSKS